MKIIAIVPIKNDKETEYIVQASEDELDTIGGVKGKAHISNRYKVGSDVACHRTYDRLKWINDNAQALPAVATRLRKLATDIEAAIPAEGE